MLDHNEARFSDQRSAIRPLARSVPCQRVLKLAGAFFAQVLAATRVGGALTAHLIPVALRRQRNGEFPRLRDLTYDLARTAAATAWIRAKAPK